MRKREGSRRRLLEKNNAKRSLSSRKCYRKRKKRVNRLNLKN